MKGCFRFVARFLAVMGAIFFVVTALIVIVLVNLESRLLDPETYKAALEEGMIYERLPRIFAEEIVLSMNYNPCESNPMACEIENASEAYLACLTDALGPEALEEIGSGKRLPTEAETTLAQTCIERYGGGTPMPENVEEGGPPQFFRSLETEDWEFILMKLLPPEDSKVLIENALDQVFAYLDGESDIAVLPLSQLKERLTGPDGIEMLERLITSQLPCSADELARMKASIKGLPESEIVLCNPPESELQGMLPDLQEQLLQAAAGIPDEAILIQPPDPVSASNTASEDLSGGLLLTRTILQFSPLIPLGFLIMVTLLAVRSLKGWLQWWGIPFTIVGGIGVVMGLLGTPLMLFAWKNLIQVPSYLSPALANLVLEFLTYIVRTITESIVITSVLLAIVGGGAIVGTFFIRPKSDDVRNTSAQSA